MFYSQFILAKKGPLGTIWIAAHLERKLRRNQVAETDIGVTVDSILCPDVPIALRLSGHLLLGVVRIYSRQVNYLFNDCSETLGKIKQAFHSAAVDLPPEATTAPFHTITLPETFDFDELELVPDSETSLLHLNGNFVDQHVTTREQITLQDTVDHNPYLGSSQFGLDERFGDGSYFSFGLDFDEELLADKVHSTAGASTSTNLPEEDMTVPSNENENNLTHLVKEDVAGPSQGGCENEVTPMEIDGQSECAKSGYHEADLFGEKAKGVFSNDHPNASVQETSCDPLIEHADLQVAPRKELDFALSNHDTPAFLAYAPRALEACTPDLNQEYCPPDEPSTPALVDETSHKEFAVENAGRFSPGFSGHPGRVAASETLLRSLPPHQVQHPWASSTNDAIRSPSSAAFQGFTHHQAASVDEANRSWPSHSESSQICLGKETAAAVNSVMDNVHTSTTKENAAAGSIASPSFPQQAFSQEYRTDALHEGPKFAANASDSFSMSSGASLLPPVGISENSQICLIKENTAAYTSIVENAHVSLVKENAAAVSTAGRSFHEQQAFLQQARLDALQEGCHLPANASNSFFMSSGASPHGAVRNSENSPCLIKENAATVTSVVENPQVSLMRENAVAVSSAFPTFPQQAFLQQGKSDALHEGLKFPASASDSFLMSSGAILPRPVGTSENSQVCLIKENVAAATLISENAQVSLVKENSTAVSTAFPNLFSQQGRSDAVLEGPKPSENASSSFLRSHEGPMLPKNASNSLMSSGASLLRPVGTSENIQLPLIKENEAVDSSVMENAQVSLVKENTTAVSLIKENATAVSTAVPSFPQQAFLLHGRTDTVHEGPKLPANAPESLISTGASLPISVGTSQDALIKENAAAITSAMENSQVSLFKENASVLATASPSFPQPAFMQQSRADSFHEGPKYPANASDSFFMSSGASLPEPVCSSSSFENSQLGNTLNQLGFAPFKQQGFSVGPYSSQTMVGVGTKSSGFQQPSTLLNTAAGGASFSSTCNTSPLFTSTGSYLPIENVLPSTHVGHMGVDKNLSATVGNVAQIRNASSHLLNAPLMSPVGMEDCERLRSAYNLQDRSANFPLLQHGISHNRMPGLELDRTKFYSPTDGATKDFLLPEADKTPYMRHETPLIASRTSAMSTPMFNSVPGDDDVLASILGRRAHTFQVISTPKEQKPPKASAVNKRPKLVARATPKRRKVELDTMSVLHGDVIRQQLASAEDIRRERHKAPCTRREVWGFLRECEGQENFDEPTLPELSPDFLELYHDVIRGRESRPLPLKGVTEAKEYSLEGMKDFCSELDNAEDSDLLAHYVKRISMKDACASQAVGITENSLPENTVKQAYANEDGCLDQSMGVVESGSLGKCWEQPKEDRKEETAAQQELAAGSIRAGHVQTLRADDEPSDGCKERAEVLVEKEGQAFSLPEVQIAEDATSQEVTETRTEEQGAQAAELVETLMISGSQGVPDKEVADLGAAVIVQQDIVGMEEQNLPSTGPDNQASHAVQIVFSSQDANLQASCIPSDGTNAIEEQNLPTTGLDKQASYEEQNVPSSQDASLQAWCIPSDGKNAREEQNLPSAGLDKQASHEGQTVLFSQDSNLQALSIPSDVNDAAEMAVSQGADVNMGEVEGEDKMVTTVVIEEETRQHRNDEEMAAAEPERDTDCFDEDNDVAYAEIDYSSDEQDITIQDDSGWSTRSRNVGKYLKTVFREMESSSKRLDQGATLGLERLLGRRTRREAARMFFETLVLKTKDYIHVEQSTAYQDILLYPNSKLMKTEF